MCSAELEAIGDKQFDRHDAEVYLTIERTKDITRSLATIRRKCDGGSGGFILGPVFCIGKVLK